MIPRLNHARHRKPVSLLSRILLPVLAALMLTAGLIFALVPASAAPVTAAAVMADRAAEFPAVLPLVLDKAQITRAALRARARAAAAILAAHTYTVRPGDSVSSVAARRCGTARDWTGIYAASRTRHWTARNANVLTAGQHLYLSCAYLPSMLRYAPAPPPPPVIRAVTVSTGYHRAYSAPVRRSYTPASSGTYHGSGSMQQCIISRESGGNSQVMNGSGHYGLYQFSSSTWAAHGGSPSSFGHASVAEQNRVYYSTVAANGYSDWAPYDGC